MTSRSIMRVAGQLVCYALLVLLVGFFSSAPSYTHLGADQAVIKLSFTHAGQRVTPCRRRSAEEMAKLAANMRRAEDCPRGRVPVVVELKLDGDVLYRGAQAPSGIAGDGASSVYRRFVVPAGDHIVEARLRDSRREQGYDHAARVRVTLVPGRSFVIDYRSDTGGFKFL